MCDGAGIDRGQAWPERLGFRLSPGLCGSDQTHGIPNRVKRLPNTTPTGEVRVCDTGFTQLV